MWDKIKFISCLFYVLFPILLFSQTEIPDQLTFLYTKAQNFITQKQYDSAQVYLNEVFESEKDLPTWKTKIGANIFSLQAEIFQQEHKLSLAEVNVKSALEIRLQLYGENDSIVAATYRQLGIVLKEKGDIPEAFQHLEKARKIQESILTPNATSLAITYYHLMSTLNTLGQYDEALAYGQKALEINQSIYGDSSLNAVINLHKIGDVYRGMGQYLQSLNFLKLGLKIGVSRLDSLDIQLGDIYYSLAHTSMEMGNYPEASTKLAKARHIYNKNNHPKELESNIFRGILYGEQGDYERAIAYNQMVLDHQLALTGPEHPKVLGALNNIAVCQLESQQFQASLTSSLKALEIQKDIFKDLHISYAQTYEMLGKAYLGLKDTIKSESYFRKALKTAEQLLDPNNPTIGAFHHSLGRFYLLTAQREKALFHYGKGRKLFQLAGIANHPDIARTQQQLARMYLREDYLSLAFERLKEAFDVLGLAVNLENPPQQLPPLSQIYSKPAVLEFLGLLGEMWYGSYLKSKREKDLTKSERAFKLAVAAVDSIRLSYQGKNSKLILSEKAQNIYRPALHVSRTLYERYGKEESLERVFFLIEKSKSAWLNEAIQKIPEQNFRGVNPEILQQEGELKVSLNHAIEQLFEAEIQNQPAAVDQWRQKRFITQQKLDSLMNILREEHPKYYQLKYASQPPPLSDLQASLDKNSLLINYYIGGRTLFIFCLTSNDKHLIIQQLPPKHIEHIEHFRQSVNNLEYIRQNSQQADSIYLEEAHLWYKLAIEPAINWADREVSRLILIPYGQMGFIPFDALLTEEIQPPADYRRLPYLMHSYEISRLYTSSLAIQKPKTFSFFSQNTKRFAGFAPDYQALFAEQAASQSENVQSQNVRVALGALPGAKKEVEYIQQLTNGEIWVDQKATKAEFMANASEFSLLHLAMHGIVNHTNPYYSYLYFNPREQSHKLFASELYNLELTADIVVLSACNSGTGNVLEGEGIMSLSHAFSYAGVSSLVMTLWSISDETTANLMQGFYQNLLENQTKGAALQHAKLKYLKQADPFYAHPFFWAAFVPIGDMSPISINQGFPLWIWLFLGLLLAIGTFITIKKFIYDQSANRIQRQY